MNNPDLDDRSASDISLHIPLGILALALAIFFGVELRSSNKQADIMKWQLSNLDKQADNLKSAQAQLADLTEQRKETVKQAQAIQGQYVNLFNDLLDMAGKGDKDAKEVVEKWGIKRNEPIKSDASSKDAPKAAK